MSSTVFASRMQEIIVINLFTAFFILFSQNSHSQEKFPTGELTVKTQDTSYDFDIELALDDSHRQYGLMFRTNLPEMNGMLFIYEEKKRISMWMKNTFIPLDILFIDDDGGEAKAVLELYGGLTDKLNIAVGDEIIYPTFGNMKK